MYLVREVTNFHTREKSWEIRTRYLPERDGGPWVTLPRFQTEAEAKAFAAILDCAFADGERSMKESFRELFGLADADHDH